MSTCLLSKLSLTAAILFLVAFGSNSAFAQPIKLARGINLGNAFDGPSEGAWGLTIEEHYFDRIAEAGFDHVRLPISWTYHAKNLAPYTVDESFFERIDEIVAQATSRGIKVIVNVHHYDELNFSPVNEWERALAIWKQIAERYNGESNELVAFEILNEPHGVFSDQPDLWDQFVEDALSVIRRTNPVRTVLVGPVNYNALSALQGFKPPFDPNLLVSVHYYEPFGFTHQGAGWVSPTPPTGVNWSANAIVVGNGWQNWSWGTTTTSRTGGLKVKWNEGWAGFRLFNFNGVVGAKKVVFSCNREQTIRVLAKRADGTGDEVVVKTKPGYHFYQAPISGTPTSPVTELFFMNSTPDPQPEFTIRHLGLPANGSFNRILFTGTAAVLEDMKKAADWSAENGFPVHLGEFGAIRLANITYRANWTQRVRAHAERVGLHGWAYWGFGVDFRVYDLVKDRWNAFLLKSLRPDFNPQQ